MRPSQALFALLLLVACGDDPQGIPWRAPQANLRSSAITTAPDWRVTVLATDVSTSSGGAEAITVIPATGDLIVRSLDGAAGCGVQFARVSRTGAVTILATFPELRNSNLTGIAYDPLSGGIIVAAETPIAICSGNRGGSIALLDLGTLALSNLFTLPWTLNPVENGTGQQQYAPDPRNPTLLYFWDSSVSKLFRLDRATGELTEVFALDQATPFGEHVSTAGNDIALDALTGLLILSDRSSNSVLEVDPAGGTATALFAGLAGPPRAVALDPAGAEIYVAIAGSIFVGPRAGGSLSLVAAGFDSPLDIAVGPATSGNGNSLFVVSRPANAVFEIARSVLRPPPGFSIRLVASFEATPVGLAHSAAGSAFGDRLFVSFRGEPSVQDRIQAVTLDGQVTSFASLVAEADPVALEFPPPGSPFGGDLYVSANNRDGGASGDHGGTIQRVDAQGNVTDFTAIGALSEPRDIVFAPGGGFETDLYVANHVNPPMDVGRVSPSGSVATYFEAGLTATDLAISSDDRMYILTDVFEAQGCNCLFVLSPSLNLSGPIAAFAGPPGSGVIGKGGAFGTDLYLVAEGSILRVDATGTVTEFATGLNATNPDGLAFSPDGSSLFVLSGLDRALYEITSVPANNPPLASPGGPYLGQEGSVIALDGSASSDPDGDELTYAWDFGDGSVATEGSPTHTYLDDGLFQVTLTVTDSKGLSSAVATSATIENVAPTVDPFAGATILRGETYTSAGVFTDPGTDTWTASVDYGDGSGLQPLSLVEKAFVLSHAYEAPGTYVVRATVSDDDGGSGIAQALVVVQSPKEATAALLISVSELVAAGVLSAGNANSLGAKLRAAVVQLNAGNIAAAANQLRAFIDQVNALVTSGRLPPEQGQALVNAANRIIRAIRLF